MVALSARACTSVRQIMYNGAMKVTTYLGLDYGHVRIGVASGDSDLRLARPLETLEKVASPADAIGVLMHTAGASELVVGLPRSLDGEDTIQTAAARAFADHIGHTLGCPVHLMDEAGTSSVAEDELKAAGKPYAKSDIDQAAAALILQDYLDSL